MGISDYDMTIKNHQFRIAELIYETAQHQLATRKAQIQIAEFGIEIARLKAKIEIAELCVEVARLNAHIQTLETTLAAMSGELHALRIETQ